MEGSIAMWHGLDFGPDEKDVLGRYSLQAQWHCPTAADGREGLFGGTVRAG